MVLINSENAVKPEDDKIFKTQILITHVEGRPPATELKATAHEILALLHETPLDGVGWSREQTEFLDKCMRMVE